MSATKPAKPAPSRATPAGPKSLEGSKQAKRNAAILLETLGGLRGPVEASEAMGVALTRYYQLETRALQAMIEALEPRPRGRRVSPGRELDRLRAEVARLQRDVLRYQALLRASQRTIGVAPAPSAKPASKTGSKGGTKGDKKVRRRRKRARGETVSAALCSDAEDSHEGVDARGNGAMS